MGRIIRNPEAFEAAQQAKELIRKKKTAKISGRILAIVNNKYGGNLPTASVYNASAILGHDGALGDRPKPGQQDLIIEALDLLVASGEIRESVDKIGNAVLSTWQLDAGTAEMTNAEVRRLFDPLEPYIDPRDRPGIHFGQPYVIDKLDRLGYF